MEKQKKAYLYPFFQSLNFLRYSILPGGTQRQFERTRYTPEKEGVDDEKCRLNNCRHRIEL